jgi:protein SCO1/2
MFNRRSLTYAGIFAAFALIVTAPLGVQALRKPEPLPVLGNVTAFALTNQDEDAFSNEEVKGRVWVADFIFATCSGPCPAMSARMRDLQHRFAGRDDLRFVTITVNPDQDTPEVLRDYAKRFEADTRQWHFLTGSREAIHALAVEGFHLGSVDEPVFHSTSFVLVDGEGRIRGYYDGLKEREVHQLAADLERLS